MDRDRFIYRLIPERNFLQTTKELQRNFDASENEQEASKIITNLSKWTQLDEDKVVLNEYRRLIETLPYGDRQYIKKHTSRAREGAPANLRTLLEGIYKGHCQLCDFWFLKRDKRPYFEIHHLNPLKGHHPKNVVVVCGNCHNQFEYADVKQDFDDGWLIRVSFNDKTYSVKQILLDIKREVFLKELFI
jgi:5-methylcytosine-specific restriction endonuclease McrA